DEKPKTRSLLSAIFFFFRLLFCMEFDFDNAARKLARQHAPKRPAPSQPPPPSLPSRLSADPPDTAKLPPAIADRDLLSRFLSDPKPILHEQPTDPEEDDAEPFPSMPDGGVHLSRRLRFLTGLTRRKTHSKTPFSSHSEPSLAEALSPTRATKSSCPP